MIVGRTVHVTTVMMMVHVPTTHGCAALKSSVFSAACEGELREAELRIEWMDLTALQEVSSAQRLDLRRANLSWILLSRRAVYFAQGDAGARAVYIVNFDWSGCNNGTNR